MSTWLETLHTPHMTQVLETLAASAYLAWSNTVSGHQSPAQRHDYQRMRQPEVGDLVLEISDWRHSVIDRLGRVQSITKEPRYPDTEPETIYLIRTLDGRVMRWHHA